jgi:predicted enzyme related to lactoylglutathione lyase
MTEFNEYAPGTFSWVDLATIGAAEAKKFYTELFGWSAVDMPAGEGMVYTMFQLEGKEVAALYELGPQQKEQGFPPHWMSYVTVASADESAAKAKSLGGQLLMEPGDVMDAGRMALIQDPVGAVLAVWQPGTHIGARLANVPGSFAWNELATTDTEKAGQFYTELFGWDTQVYEMPSGAYTTFLNQERMNAGMIKMTEEWGDAPPHWLVYFAVADCDQSTEKARELGAEILVSPMEAGEVGRFSVIQDPQGAVFSIIKLNNPGQ